MKLHPLSLTQGVAFLFNGENIHIRIDLIFPLLNHKQSTSTRNSGCYWLKVHLLCLSWWLIVGGQEGVGFWLRDWKWGNFVTLPVLYISVECWRKFRFGERAFFSVNFSRCWSNFLFVLFLTMLGSPALSTCSAHELVKAL